MRQVLARRTVILHLRNMFNAFNGTEAQDIASIRNLVNSVLHREQEFARCKEWTDPTAVRQSKRVNSTRVEERIFVDYEQMAQRRVV